MSRYCAPLPRQSTAASPSRRRQGADQFLHMATQLKACVHYAKAAWHSNVAGPCETRPCDSRKYAETRTALCCLCRARLDIGDEILDADQRQPVLPGEGDQFGKPGHGAVVVSDFADHAGGSPARKAREIDGGFRMAGAAAHAARMGAQWED